MNPLRKIRSLLEGGASGAPDRASKLTMLEQEFLPPVLEIQETPPSPLKQKVVWAIVFVFASLLVWSYLGRIEVASTVSGKLIPDGKVKIIQPIETSVVRAIHVHEGQRVHQGDLLLELDPTISAADYDSSRKRLAIAKEREADARRLMAIGALSRTDYLKAKEDLATAEGDTTKARQRYDLEWLRAPVDGVVQSVAVTTLGAVVTPAQALVTIVPVGTSLIVEAMLSNNDIGFAKVGQPAQIKVDTFPFQQYGTIRGTLVWVSPDAEDSSNKNQNNGNNASGSPPASSPPSGGSAYFYRVHIKPDVESMRVSGRDIPLSAGMTVQADITTDDRRVIEFFLSPIIKYLDEGLKVR